MSAEDSIYTELNAYVGDAFVYVDAETSNRIADVDAEESRAMAAEGSLASDLADETSRAMDAEVSLENSLSTEISDRVVAIDNEASTRLAADQSLESSLETEIIERVSADLSLTNALDSESSMRVEGDQSLQNQINFITSNVDPAALDSLTEIVSAFQSADGDINNAITTLADAAAASLSVEVARATSVEAVLSADLSTEASARIADVDAEESRATAAEGSIAANLSTEISDRVVAIDNEASIRLAADQSLAADLSAEISRAQDAEASLATELSYEVSYLISNTDLTAIDSFAEVSDAVSAEVSNREAAVSAEESTRIAADASLEAELSADIAGLADVDNATISLDTATNTIKLKQEIAAPDSGMYTFNSNVEVSDTLTVGGVDVMAEISSEISRAEAAEASLATELSYEVSYLIANTDLTAIDSFAEVSDAVSAEVSRAESAESVLALDSETYTFNNRPSMIGFNESPDGELTLFTADIVSGTHIVFLNGLMQKEGSDYDVVTVIGGGGSMTASATSFGAVLSDSASINVETTLSINFISAPAATDKVDVYGVPSGISFGGLAPGGGVLQAHD
jgi:hypothetical protein